ncbi:MAG: F0F1 ATP synthase subunit delta [Alistipes indistinctus]
MIPSRYAKALYEYAGEKSATERVYGEMQRLAGSFAAEPALRRALDNPRPHAGTKERVGLQRRGRRPSDELERFVKLVLSHKRMQLLHRMALDYMALYRRAHNISTGELQTAVAVDETTEQRLKEWIVSRTHGTVELRTLVRPDILGGFIFEMNSMRLDASVATQLREIREQFIDRNKRIV